MAADLKSADGNVVGVQVPLPPLAQIHCAATDRKDLAVPKYSVGGRQALPLCLRKMPELGNGLGN
jgi:hypothetical protein